MTQLSSVHKFFFFVDNEYDEEESEEDGKIIPIMMKSIVNVTSYRN